MRDEQRFYTVIVVCLLIGGLIGFVAGSAITLNWAVTIGFKVLKQSNVTLGIDENLLRQGISQYRDKIEVFIDRSK